MRKKSEFLLDECVAIDAENSFEIFAKNAHIHELGQIGHVQA